MSEEATVSPENWGQFGYLTEAQISILNQFIEEVPPEHITYAKFTVETLEQLSLRFLRARKFDLIKAKELINDCYKRKLDDKAKIYAEMKPDNCAKCDVAALKTFYPHTQRGYDRFRRPLLFERNGRTDVNATHLLTTNE